MADNEGARKNGKFMVVCLTPDVCKTPVGNTVVPIPYPITATLNDSTSTSTNVNFDGDPAFILDKSIVTKVTGDEPGTAGGTKSGTNRSIVKPIKASSTVKVNKKRVVRHSDQCDMNNGNTKGKVVYQGVSKKAGSSSNSNPPVKPETLKEEEAKTEKKGIWSRMSDGVHTALDIAGFIPGLGAIPDLANAAIYAVEGNAAMAALSVVAAVPGVGDGVKAGSMAYKGGKVLLKQAEKQAVKQAEKQVAKQVEKKASKVILEKTEKETAEKLAKKKAEKAAAKKETKDAAKQGKDGTTVKGKKKKKKDPCKALEKGAPGQKYKGGKYSKVAPGGSARGQEAHHMPSKAGSPLKETDGPAIQMDKADHRQTASCDQNNPAYVSLQRQLASKGKAGMLAAMMMDIKDIRSKFGNKYDSAIAQMMAYSKCKGYI